jgi:hypothetical protein
LQAYFQDMRILVAEICIPQRPQPPRVTFAQDKQSGGKRNKMDSIQTDATAPPQQWTVVGHVFIPDLPALLNAQTRIHTGVYSIYAAPSKSDQGYVTGRATAIPTQRRKIGDVHLRFVIQETQRPQLYSPQKMKVPVTVSPLREERQLILERLNGAWDEPSIRRAPSPHALPSLSQGAFSPERSDAHKPLPVRVIFICFG